MGHTFTNHLYHIVFSTKGRESFIGSAVRAELYKYIVGIARNNKGTVLRINGDKDHVHLLAKVSPSISISDFVRLIETNSSKWMSERFSSMRDFAWQSGYASFTVSESRKSVVVEYIEHQAAHHKKLSFAEELAGFLTKNKITFDRDAYLG